jgi:hypothetical protein
LLNVVHLYHQSGRGTNEANKKKSLTGEVKQKRRERVFICLNKEMVISLFLFLRQ